MSDAINPAVMCEYTVGVTGATGYVGGRLVPALLEAGYRVRCLVREPRKLDARPWRHHPHVEVIAVDIVDSAAVATALLTCPPTNKPRNCFENRLLALQGAKKAALG